MPMQWSLNTRRSYSTSLKSDSHEEQHHAQQAKCQTEADGIDVIGHNGSSAQG
jgi:hypothetical protein